MKLRTQLFLDRIFFKPIVFLLNLLLRLGGLLLRRDHSLRSDFKIIAVCKFKGMGSIIQATPLLQSLRKRYPRGRIVFITTEGNREIVQKISCVDGVLCLNDTSIFSLLSSAPNFLRYLIASRIEVYLDLEIYSDFSGFVALVSMAKQRIGFYLRSSHYRLGIYTHMMFYNIKAPIFQAYLQMGRLLHCDDVVKTLYPVKSHVRRLEIGGAESLDLEKTQYAVINTNASDLRSERRWGGKNFTALMEKILLQYPEYKIVLTGNRKEKAYVDQITRHFAGQKEIINLAGRTSMEELIAVLQHARIMISNDTGPLHLAHAVETPTVALFGPCSPEQYGYPGKNYILYKNLYCSPCVHEFTLPPCQGNNRCMKLISVEEVMGGVHYFLSSAKQEQAINTRPSGSIYSAREDGVDNVLGIVR